MSVTTAPEAPALDAPPKRLSAFERYLTVWVGLCMVAGVVLGRSFPGLVEALRGLEFGAGSQINAPIAVLIWLMIVPMMMKIDFSALTGVTRRSKGLLVTLFVNWVVKPFSMALLGWLFFQGLFLPLIGEELARQYTAGVIILAAAPCTAMVAVVDYCGGLPDFFAPGLRRMPPVLILHGDADRTVPVTEAYKLERLLREREQPQEMHIYPGLGHGFTGPEAQDAFRRTLEFLDKHLRE